MTSTVPQTLPLDVALQQAAAHHQAGRLHEAEQLYRAVLQAQPYHADANHNLGVLAGQVGQHAAGLPYLKTALAINPSKGQYSLSYAEALLATGQAREALNILQAAMQRGLQTPAAQALRQKAEAAALSVYVKGAAPTPVEMNQLVALFDVGRYAELETRVRLLADQYPDCGVIWMLLGASLQTQGKNGLPALQKATELMPDDAEAHSNLGNALRDLGQLDDAVASYRRALKIKPDFAEAHSNLGNVLRDLGQLDDAVVSYGRALETKPDFAEAHSNLGNALRDLGQLDDAVASYRRALEIKPDFAEAYYNRGVALKDLGHLDDAVASYRRALEINPDYAEAHGNLGVALRDFGRLDDAVASFRRALEIKPDFADAHINLGTALQALGRLDDAVVSFRRALEIKPDYAEAHIGLGTALQDFGQLDRAVASFRRALEINPDLSEAHGNLGNALQDLGQLDGALASYRRALEIKPDFDDAYCNLLFLYGYHVLIDPHEYLAQARNWEQSCVPAQDRQKARHRDFRRLPLVGKRLRVGYVSGDYRQHSVSYFVEQLFTHHDRARIELFAYSTHGQHDAVTARLQASAEHWVPLMGLPDAAIRERIEADGIDVLIDLSGHTDHNRLGVFARRAAPVQAHYLGYFASTGLTEMDYWIGDEILTPAGTDSHFSERVWRLPRVWMSYDGKAEAPVSSWQPSKEGTVWLGSFNNLGKLTPATLALWARVLHALPEGKLLLKTKHLRDIGNRQRILDAMSGHGILPDRIELQDGNVTPGWSAHMSYYDRLDIALDPVGGVGGGTTTCDALWMGVPVIAREGDRMASRMTASMLEGIGHPEWISRSEAEYIDKIVALARDVDQRKALRSSQRKQMAASLLCDARGLAICLENAYFEMFERWFDKKSQSDVHNHVRWRA